MAARVQQICIYGTKGSKAMFTHDSNGEYSHMEGTHQDENYSSQQWKAFGLLSARLREALNRQ